MATHTIDYLHHVDQPVPRIEEPIAGHTLVDSTSQLIRRTLIGPSRWAERARRLVSAHATHDNTVILEGEPGTGKRFLARLIHQCSRYAQGPFVSLSLSSTTYEAARALLFGRTRIRFDDLPSSEKGLIELAVGGTIYFDGLTDCSSNLPDDIARFIEDTGLNRSGDGSVRILFGSTTHTNGCHWRASISPQSNGLSCEKIQIPALRERPDDIEALAAHFVKQRCEQMCKESRVLSSQAVAALTHYDWPRNVSELRLVVNQMVKQSAPPTLDAALLPAYLRGPDDENNIRPAFELDLDDEVRKFEINLICAALKQSRGLQNKAAQLLRIRPTTLFMKIKRYNIDVADFRPRAVIA